MIAEARRALICAGHGATIWSLCPPQPLASPPDKECELAAISEVQRYVKAESVPELVAAVLLEAAGYERSQARLF